MAGWPEVVRRPEGRDENPRRGSTEQGISLAEMGVAAGNGAELRAQRANPFPSARHEFQSRQEQGQGQGKVILETRPTGDGQPYLKETQRRGQSAECCIECS